MNMKLGIIREGKVPPDSRVPLIPEQCVEVDKKFGWQVIVQPSSGRCYDDSEFLESGIRLSDELNDCDILLGVKEVPTDQLIPGKTYLFFSHTIKEQPHNRKLLQAILEKKIWLIDYEVLMDEEGNRLIAFGKFAGMVGAHNALYTYSRRTRLFDLPRMKDLKDYEEAKSIYRQIVLPPIKIVLTGGGRVANGAALVLKDMGVRQVTPEAFLKEKFREPVFTQLHSTHYVKKKNGETFDTEDFYKHPDLFESAFQPYSKCADIMINGIYWDKRAPAFFTREDMRQKDFKIRVIADVTCDIAPESSIPSTLKASTITNPVFGYNPETGCEEEPYQPENIDMMTIDNLPNELPRDASKAFGRQFIDKVIVEFENMEKSEVIKRATIAKDGKLGPHFQYLKDYVSGKNFADVLP